MAEGMEDGLVIAKIRNEPSWRHIPFVAMTGADIDFTKRDILEGFGIPRLVAPWSDEAVFDALYQVTISKRRLEKMNS